ncbi:MAG: hypothetical protein ACRDH0_03690 [Actinomycetota bacterium]
MRAGEVHGKGNCRDVHLAGRFVADETSSAELYPGLEALHGTVYMDTMIEETGAVVMGRRTFEVAEDPDWYVGNYEFQVPMFVRTHNPPSAAPKEDERGPSRS